MDKEVLQYETRMSGYLHKKGKLRMVSSWKRYWFVLKDRLLLYYRSKEEYEAAISPCKGSINLGPPCSVKSFPSLACVFQIETRSNTFTFKAENAIEQKKWMHAILLSLNQNQNFSAENISRLSHFRYSLDNLIPECEPNEKPTKLERQYTVPHKIKSTQRTSTEIIEKLQKMGAHSYGGSLGAISKIASKKPASQKSAGSEKCASHNSIYQCTDEVELRETDFNLIRPRENTYERISGNSNYYSVPRRPSNSLTIHQRAAGENGSENSTFYVENENYSVPLKQSDLNLYERDSGDSPKSENLRYSFLVENDNYSIPMKSPTKSLNSSFYERQSTDSRKSENSYSVTTKNSRSSYVESSSINNRPKITNTNDLIIENDQYCARVEANLPAKADSETDEVIYAEPTIDSDEDTIDHNRNNVVVENSFYATSSDLLKYPDNVYEDLDRRNRRVSNETSVYCEPVFTNNNDDETKNIQESKQKSIFNIANMLSKSNKKPKEKKLTKSKSFVTRVWTKRKNKKQNKQEEEDIYYEIDVASEPKIDLTDKNAVQMLSELQNILETKKAKLKQSASGSSSLDHESQTYESNKSSTSNADSDQQPSLPPKSQKSISYCQEVLQSNQPVDHEQVRSLDEILQDLDAEKVEHKNKVKILIDRFNETESEDEVVLRKHVKPDFKINRRSDELDKLLEELAKVTSAPIMTPGVTSSLVNPHISKDEWLKLLPIRQRRLSEPDYDIPRSHKSLQHIPKAKKPDAIPATRFFGPALPTTTNDQATEIEVEDSMCNISMTPDSLEVTENQKMQYSYTSHTYFHNKNDGPTDLTCLPHNLRHLNDDAIYASPKPYLSIATHIVNTCHNICSKGLSDEHTIIYKNVRNINISDEVFKDSLELSNTESLTEF